MAIVHDVESHNYQFQACMVENAELFNQQVCVVENTKVHSYIYTSDSIVYKIMCTVQCTPVSHLAGVHTS